MNLYKLEVGLLVGYQQCVGWCILLSQDPRPSIYDSDILFVLCRWALVRLPSNLNYPCQRTEGGRRKIHTNLQRPRRCDRPASQPYALCEGLGVVEPISSLLPTPQRPCLGRQPDVLLGVILRKLHEYIQRRSPSGLLPKHIRPESITSSVNVCKRELQDAPGTSVHREKIQ